MTTPFISTKRSAFSLIEVVLAIGIFLVTVLALVGLLGPALKSIDEVEKTDEVSSVVNTINAFLQNSPEIAPSASKFDAIYKAVSQDYATILVFRAYDVNDNVSLKIGFVDETEIGANAQVDAADIYNGSTVLAAGTIYRVVLTPSSVNPASQMVVQPELLEAYPRYQMIQADPAVYPEGYFAMEVRIFAEDPSTTFTATTSAADLAVLKDKEPIFTYNTAINR
jgi:Tfp pilus assembly protein PilV